MVWRWLGALKVGGFLGKGHFINTQGVDPFNHNLNSWKL